MKFSTKALGITLLAAVANALTLTITDSTNESLNGLGLSSIHEGAAINYFLLGSTPEELTYGDGKIYKSYGELTYYFNYASNIVQLSVVDAPTISITDGKINLGQQLYACKNINDPYNYSEQSFFVTVGELGTECYPVSIQVNDLGETSSVAATASSTVGYSVDVPVAYTFQLTDTWAYASYTESSSDSSASATIETVESTSSEVVATVAQVSSAGASANRAGSVAAGLAAVFMMLL